MALVIYARAALFEQPITAVGVAEVRYALGCGDHVRAHILAGLSHVGHCLGVGQPYAVLDSVAHAWWRLATARAEWPDAVVRGMTEANASTLVLAARSAARILDRTLVKEQGGWQLGDLVKVRFGDYAGQSVRLIGAWWREDHELERIASGRPIAYDARQESGTSLATLRVFPDEL
ncbi:hypothetical protein [Lentzea sp. NBRC 105346]|uniref:hypothetical protein n=1 Tax=Lentzea sp. NBRC 105346 TaxID=3032205 RepID=UPI002555FDCF|nr:hypothetical protein [Lentzea sp. NBRC 105346]